jgi:hypothetical protein
MSLDRTLLKSGDLIFEPNDSSAVWIETHRLWEQALGDLLVQGAIAPSGRSQDGRLTKNCSRHWFVSPMSGWIDSDVGGINRVRGQDWPVMAALGRKLVSGQSLFGPAHHPTYAFF